MRYTLLSIFCVFMLTACKVAPDLAERAERRVVAQERYHAARSYSEFLRAKYASLNNDPHNAAVFYGNAVRANPDDIDLIERAVFTALISGDIEVAEDTALAAKPDVIAQTSLPRLVLASRALRKGKSRLTQRILETETSSQFHDTIALGLMAWATLERSGKTDALAVLDRPGPQDDLLSGLTLAAKGLIQLHAKDDAGAEETFQALWDDGVRLAVTTEYLARLLYRSGEQEKAIRLLTIFSSRVGQNAAIDTLRAELISGKTPNLPRPSIREGAALAVYIPAAALANHTDGDLAGVYFAVALGLDPDLHVARTLWGDALDTANRRDDAIAVLAQIPESSPFYATSRGQIAWALRRENRNDAALDVARDALVAASDRNLKIQLGDLFRSLGQLDDAERIFSEIIVADEARDVVDWRLLYARGAAREQLDRWEEAEPDLVRALELAPDQPALLNYLGYSWIDRGVHLEKSFDMVKRAVELRPNAGFIVDSLGWAHYKLGNYEEAVRHLERAVVLSPSEPVPNEHLGDAYWRVGRKLEATFQWNRAIRLAPDSDNVILLETKLESGLEEPETSLIASREADVVTP